MVEIEFFHDVICSFCFPMSYRMRQIQKNMPEVKIKHRSFALVKNVGDFDLMFTSREAAKAEILTHWDQANKNDDLHRFNIQGMKNASFAFPSSMNPLKACQAAYFIGGENAYWDLFDALQNSLFVKNQNIELQEIIEECVKEVNLDLNLWRDLFKSEKTEKSVEADIEAAKQYGITSVPCVMINGKTKLSGAQSYETIKQAIEQINAEVATDLNGAACTRNQDGTFECI